MVVAYLMKIQDMSYDEALQVVCEKRPVANPNASFRRQLQEYDQRLRRTTTVGKGKSVIGATVRGPQGPSLPPSASADDDEEEKKKESEVGSSPTTKKKKKASIGPQLPPHLQTKGEEEVNSSEAKVAVNGDGANTAAAEEAVEEPVVIIGPNFPPSHKRHRDDKSQDDSVKRGKGE